MLVAGAPRLVQLNDVVPAARSNVLDDYITVVVVVVLAAAAATWLDVDDQVSMVVASA